MLCPPPPQVKSPLPLGKTGDSGDLCREVLETRALAKYHITCRINHSTASMDVAYPVPPIHYLRSLTPIFQKLTTLIIVWSTYLLLDTSDGKRPLATRCSTPLESSDVGRVQVKCKASEPPRLHINIGQVSCVPFPSRRFLSKLTPGYVRRYLSSACKVKACLSELTICSAILRGWITWRIFGESY